MAVNAFDLQDLLKKLRFALCERSQTTIHFATYQIKSDFAFIYQNDIRFADSLLNLRKNA